MLGVHGATAAPSRRDVGAWHVPTPVLHVSPRDVAVPRGSRVHGQRGSTPRAAHRPPLLTERAELPSAPDRTGAKRRATAAAAALSLCGFAWRRARGARGAGAQTPPYYPTPLRATTTPTHPLATATCLRRLRAASSRQTPERILLQSQKLLLTFCKK